MTINTEQFQYKFLKFLDNTDEWWSMHHNKAISEQSSKFLCNTDDLCSYASKQSNFRTDSKFLCKSDDYELCTKTKRFQNKVLNFFVILMEFGIIAKQFLNRVLNFFVILRIY